MPRHHRGNGAQEQEKAIYAPTSPRRRGTGTGKGDICPDITEKAGHRNRKRRYMPRHHLGGGAQEQEKAIYTPTSPRRWGTGTGKDDICPDITEEAGHRSQEGTHLPYNLEHKGIESYNSQCVEESI